MHHTDEDNLDPRTDITDFYVFQKPGDPSRSIFVLNVYSEAPSHGAAFNPEASYEFKVDVNGDAQPEIAFHIRFASTGAAGQGATVFRAEGAAAQEAGVVGEIVIPGAPVSFGREARLTEAGGYRFFAGLRSDPFFADPVGYHNNMQWTGQDYFADKNVLGIVLEVPNPALGPQPQLGVWARTLIPVHGALTPVNQAGRPGNHQIKQGAQSFNATPPARQRGLFHSQSVAMFRGFGYDQDQATALAMEWLPDILPYDYSKAEGYPNGRRLIDDVANNWWRLMTKGRVTSDRLKPHKDYLPDFPFLGPPH